MMMFHTRRVFGVTLIELMVVIAILAILGLIGYPLYTQQLLKGRRGDARAGIMEIAMAQEREYAAWGGYSEPAVAIAGIAANDGAPAPDPNSNFHNDLRRISTEYAGDYSFTITADNGTFSITAAPTGGQTDDTSCFSFTVDQTGAKSAADNGGADQTNLCW